GGGGGHDWVGMATGEMAVEGWDHLELWVGNAKQAAYWYEHALGFELVAYGGPETGIRDRASYVMRQGEIRLVLTSALREASGVMQHVSRHGDGVKEIALPAADPTEAYRPAVPRGARGVAEPHWVSDENGRVELSSIATYGDTLHTFVNRGDYAGVYLPGYEPVDDGAGTGGTGLQAIDHCVGNVELGRMNHWV